MLILLLARAFALTEERKDEYCYLFSSNLVQAKAEEIQKHIIDYPDLNEVTVTSKAIEKAFYSCLHNLKDEHVKQFNFENIHDFSLYKEFITLELEALKSPEDLKLTKKFNDRRQKIAERARLRKQEKQEGHPSIGKDL